MQLEIEHKPKQFQPIKVTLTLESQDELNYLATVFGSSVVSQAMETAHNFKDDYFPAAWRDKLVNIGATYHEPKPCEF